MADTWLGRFRIAGVNWEGRKWYLAKGGVSLAREINILYPARTGLDGTVASKGHDSRSPRSDHRPYPYTASPAVVRAIDAGEKVENDGAALFEAIRQTRDPRIKYVLHEDRIFSSYTRGTRDPWEVHRQSVGHYGHVHISLNSKADSDGSPWGLVDVTQEGDEQVLNTVQGKSQAVADFQRDLVILGFDLGDFTPYAADYPKGADGYFGGVAEAGTSAFQEANGLNVTGQADGLTVSYARFLAGSGSVVDEVARKAAQAAADSAGKAQNRANSAHNRLDKLHQV